MYLVQWEGLILVPLSEVPRIMFLGQSSEVQPIKLVYLSFTGLHAIMQKMCTRFLTSISIWNKLTLFLLANFPIVKK